MRLPLTIVLRLTQESPYSKGEGFQKRIFPSIFPPQVLRNSRSPNNRVGRIFEVGDMSQEETNILLEYLLHPDAGPHTLPADS